MKNNITRHKICKSYFQSNVCAHNRFKVFDKMFEEKRTFYKVVFCVMLFMNNFEEKNINYKKFNSQKYVN